MDAKETAIANIDKDSLEYRLYLTEINQALADHLGDIEINQEHQSFVFQQGAEPAIIVNLCIADAQGLHSKIIILRFTNTYSEEGFALYRIYKAIKNRVEPWMASATFDQAVTVASHELRYLFWADRLAAKHGFSSPVFDNRINLTANHLTLART